MQPVVQTKIYLVLMTAAAVAATIGASTTAAAEIIAAISSTLCEAHGSFCLY